MRVSIERLRNWLLAGAVVLAMAIAGFLGYAHFRAHGFLTELPGKLGIDLRQETNAFTYSQSVKGKTVFTIHAAKAIQRKDGKVTLRDVGIVLYGRTQDRADRIYGNEFEYDQNAGVVRAMGQVHLDLQAPTPADAATRMDYAAGREVHAPGKPEADDERLIHVITSGLIYMMKLGVASTEQEIEFQYRGVNGHARGADYDADTGQTVLHADVRVSGLRDGRPMRLEANRAELDRVHNRVVLMGAKAVSVGASGARGSAEETASARQAIFHLRSDGSVERVEAEGEVTLAGADRRLTAPRAIVLISAKNRPTSAQMYGGLEVSDQSADRVAHGRSDAGLAGFNPGGEIDHIDLSGAVDVQERVRVSPAAEWAERRLTGQNLRLVLANGEGARRWVRSATAEGNAHLVLHDAGPRDTARRSVSEMSGDVLIAEFRTIEDRPQIAELRGEGHTVLHRISGTGVDDVSSSDMLEVAFETGKAHPEVSGKGQRSPGLGGIGTAVQTGHVSITHLVGGEASRNSPGMTSRATAERALYEGGSDRVTMTGHVQMSRADDGVWADRVVLEHGSGDATAEGAVRATYRQGSGTDEAHVLANRAEFRQASGQAVFFGTAAARARLWQGGSQVEAAVLELKKGDGLLFAHGDERSGSDAVRTVLANGGADGATAKVPRVVRVQSHDLRYSDVLRRAEFAGGVVLQSADGTVRSRTATVYLQKRTEAQGKPEGQAAHGAGGLSRGGSGLSLGGGVERIVANGGIRVEQPGRRVLGEQAVYTAGDGKFVVTGTAGAPPEIVDDAEGRVTGASLRFHSGDNKVVVSRGNENGSAGPRVQTETRVKPQP